HRPSLARDPLHAPALPRHWRRPDDPVVRQGVRRRREGAVQALPQGAGQARLEDRRYPEASRLHLTPSPGASSHMSGTIEKVSLIVSKGSFEGVYPALIMANGARMEGIEANVFFTFFGMDAINKSRNESLKVATVGNPGLHIPTMVGGL